jgi:hypothetical protein
MNPSKDSLTSKHGGHLPTISKILIYVNKRWAFGEGIIAAALTLMTLRERVLAATIDKATDCHEKCDEYELCTST